MSAYKQGVSGRRMYQVVDLSRVRQDEATQPRVCMDEETIQEYVTRMKLDEVEGVILDSEDVMFTPLVIFDDGTERWLADGFHRMEAARRAGFKSFQAELRRGSKRDAVLYSLGANARHGKRRTNADKRQAVERALADEDWGICSDSRVAEICCVSQPFVSKVRRELVREGELTPRKQRKGADGKVYDVTNIGGQSTGRSKSKATTSSATENAPENTPASVADAVQLAPESVDEALKVQSLGDASVHEGNIDVLFVRGLVRKDWYDVAAQGVPLLGDGGVLIVPQTRDLCFAVSHLMREKIDYQGASVLPGAQVFQVWSASGAGLDVPAACGSLGELINGFGQKNGHVVEYCPRTR